LRIERDDGPAPPGEVGEIVVRGPSLTPGYLDRSDATAYAWRGGWFHTGDLGRLDEEGYLYVLDRRDDLIVSGGENVYPAEVEATLLAHPAVADAGVVGLPHETWGQVPVAVIQRRAGVEATAEDLIGHCAAHLANYKVPRAIHWRDTLPRNAAGKLLRRLLRENW
jgi:o-succinylbenzoate---CoA ligase